MNKNDQTPRENPERKSAAGFLICVILCVALAAALLVLGGFWKTTEAPQNPEPETIPETTEAQGELSVSDLLTAVLTVKDDLQSAAEDMADGDQALAQLKVSGIGKKTETIRQSLNATLEALGTSLPSLRSELTNIQNVLDLVDSASSMLMQPLIQQLAAYPLSGLATEEGIDVSQLYAYLDFLETLMPDIAVVVEQASSVDLSVVDSDGEITQYLDQFAQLLELYRADPTVFSRLKSVLGADGDRLYVVAAQNSAEVRASGGFPGAIGTVRIRDGILTVEDFKKVYDVFSSYTPQQANVTTQEYRLFHGGLSAPRDADYCPDFERVAHIWALGYETAMQEEVDGVIAVTPVLVQKVLAIMDEEIILFDGLVLNGSNATKVLQHDLYFNYFGGEYVNNAMVLTDQLFADAAKKAVAKVTENLLPEYLPDYLSVIQDAFADRTLMLWAKDEEEQALIREMDWDGGLNTDPEKPEIGIYFNCTVASKMGIFLHVDTQLGDGTPNADGSCTYPVTVTFSNTITQEELKAAQAYITAGSSGAFTGSAYFFAPAGGTVADFTTSSGAAVQRENYHDLELGFVSSFSTYADKPFVVTFTVTTAPGVDAVPTISQTPTIQDYR